VIHDVLLLLLPPLSERLTWLVKCACQFEGAEHLTKIGVFHRGDVNTTPLAYAFCDMSPECPERGVNFRRGNIDAGMRE
jgi:hypothetical protein